MPRLDRFVGKICKSFLSSILDNRKLKVRLKENATFSFHVSLLKKNPLRRDLFILIHIVSPLSPKVVTLKG